jgi:hypothetical protein
MKNEQSLKWTMGGLFIVSALLLSSNTTYSKYGYILFAVAHLLGVGIFYKYRDTAMLWSSIIFLGIDVWGIYRWFI